MGGKGPGATAEEQVGPDQGGCGLEPGELVRSRWPESDRVRHARFRRAALAAEQGSPREADYGDKPTASLLQAHMGFQNGKASELTIQRGRRSNLS